MRARLSRVGAIARASEQRLAVILAPDGWSAGHGSAGQMAKPKQGVRAEGTVQEAQKTALRMSQPKSAGLGLATGRIP